VEVAVGRPRTSDESRPQCPFCHGKNSNIVKAGYYESIKYGKERKWYCNNCKRSWSQEKIARDMIGETLRNITDKDKGYVELLKAIKGGRPTLNTVNQYTTINNLHSRLQNVALAFLLEHSAKAEKEYNLSLTRTYRMDVVGQKNGRLIAMECGDISSDKQSDFWDFFSDSTKAELYWLPFNAGRLFKIIPVENSEKQFSEFRKYSKARK